MSGPLRRVVRHHADMMRHQAEQQRRIHQALNTLIGAGWVVEIPAEITVVPGQSDAETRAQLTEVAQAMAEHLLEQRLLQAREVDAGTVEVRLFAVIPPMARQGAQKAQGGPNGVPGAS